MFFKTKKKDIVDELDAHEKELFEHAKARIKEKKALYRHFVLFLAGCISMIVLNIVLGFGSSFQFFELDWFVFGVINTLNSEVVRGISLKRFCFSTGKVEHHIVLALHEIFPALVLTEPIGPRCCLPFVG